MYTKNSPLHVRCPFSAAKVSASLLESGPFCSRVLCFLPDVQQAPRCRSMRVFHHLRAMCRPVAGILSLRHVKPDPLSPLAHPWVWLYRASASVFAFRPADSLLHDRSVRLAFLKSNQRDCRQLTALMVFGWLHLRIGKTRLPCKHTVRPISVPLLPPTAGSRKAWPASRSCSTHQSCARIRLRFVLTSSAPHQYNRSCE